ncbi:SpoIIE family protein phosphatase [Kineococcus terrestris]|uniref:SpoIIE family protein phosphatase n=1 Tax=Kineococcus terrestris TaxID=2044856 RepID=UPI0034DB2752
MAAGAAVDPLLLRAWQEVSEGIVVLDAEHRWEVLHVNATGARLLELPVEDVVGRPFADLFPDAGGAGWRAALARTRETEDLVTWTGQVPGRELWFTARAQRVDGKVLCAFRDVTEQHRVEVERDELLRTTQEGLEHTRRLLRLSQALTATETLQDVADAVVDVARREFGAAYAALSVVDHERGLLRTPFSGEYAEGAVEQWTDLPLDGPGPGTLALRTGRPRFDDAATLHAEFPELAHRWRAADVRYVVTVPLFARDTSVGLLTMVWHEDLALDENERALLVALAAGATQALQRAQLLAEHTRTARTLQRAMLTRSLPQPDHLEVIARYVAAGGGQVGGDWYDVLLLPTGSTLTVIGDVAGHDVRAAAAMGQLRIALRALAVDRDDGPAALLTRLEGVVTSLGDEQLLASCLVGRVEQRRDDLDRSLRWFRWANAGHPPPLLVQADGRTRLLTSPPELIVGTGAGLERTDHLAPVPAGSTLLLYTDGLVERRRGDLDAGLQRLRAVGGVLAHPDLAAGLDALLAELGTDGDDVAVLAVRFHPQD